jgi:hypothetical protein
MRKFVARLVSRKLTKEEKDRRLTLFMDSEEQLDEDTSLGRVLTCDGIWRYWYDSDAKCKSMEWKLKNSHKQK